jgi:hypothetical protein
MLREDKNTKGNRNPETQITGKKAKNLSKKKSKLEILEEVPMKSSQEESLQKLNIVRIVEQRRM